jgi:hypothetical protein
MENNQPEFTEPELDLKHDTMEFAANTDGEDVVETDEIILEEEAVTAKELDELDNEAAPAEQALEAAAADQQNDPDRLPAEEWTDDIPDFGAAKPDPENEDQAYPGV